MSTHDDDALSWADGTDDTSHVDHWPAAGGATAAPGPAAAASDSAVLIVTGIIAGVYLLFTVGWIIAAGRDTFSVPNLLGEVMYQLGQFLAIAAPATWFAATLVLTRTRGAGIRIAALIAGALLLAPWPFIVSAVAS